MGVGDTGEKKGKYHKEKNQSMFQKYHATVCMFKYKIILGRLCGGIQNGVQLRTDVEG